MNRKSKIAILSFSSIQSDGRVLRQIEYLGRHFELSMIGYGHLPNELAERARMLPIEAPSGLARRGRKSIFLPIGKLFPGWAYETWYWSEREYRDAYRALIQTQADAIHANDWEALPVAVRAAEKIGAKVVLDLHEYAPLLRDNRRYWRVFYKPAVEHFMRRYLSKISASVTVSQAIVEKYSEVYGIRPIVVMNAPRRAGAVPFRPTEPTRIQLIHHGNAVRDRKLESMIAALSLTDDRYVLHLMLVDRSRGYISDLRATAQRLAPGRVFFHPPVQPGEIVERISEFDMGFYLMPAASFNQFAALPNKFFDFVMAGLAVCIGPSPEMARLVQQFGFGLVAPSLDPRSVAALLNRLSATNVDQMKQRAIEARSSLNADTELTKLVELYTRLFDGE